MRRTILGHGVLLLLLAAGCGGSGDGQATGSTSTTSPTTASSTSDTSGAVGSGITQPAMCTVRDLEVSLGESEGAAGTVYRALVFTNAGDDSCTIEGIPHVAFVTGEHGEQVGAAAASVGAAGPAVMLEPESAAAAPVGFVQTGNFDPDACQPTDVSGLRVSPPGREADEFVAFDTTACGAEDFGTMTVRTVHPGTDLTG
jgi:hypothetical protein